jgi:hypothetical protein
VIETFAGKGSAYSNVADETRLVSLTLVIAKDSGNFLKNERRAVWYRLWSHCHVLCDLLSPPHRAIFQLFLHL